MANLVRLTCAFLLTVALASAPAVTGAWAKGKTHRIAVHVSTNDKAVINIALNNVQNLVNFYKKKGDKAVIEVVAYGPGLVMYNSATSPVKERIATMSLELPNLRFSACQNTYNKMSKKAGKALKLVDEAVMVPSGIVRLVELQEKGYRYIRP